MSDLSDFRRLVHDPEVATLRARIAELEAAVPRIKAEALHSAAVAWWTLNHIDEEGGVDLGDMTGPVSDFVNLTTDEWLHARADHTEAAGR